MSIQPDWKYYADRYLARELEKEMADIDRALSMRYDVSGIIARRYDARFNTTKTCIGCGSATQPCCGH